MRFTTTIGDYTFELLQNSSGVPAAFNDRIEATSDDPAGDSALVIRHRTDGYLYSLNVHGVASWRPFDSLFIPETGILFAGAGETAIAVDINARRRLWTEPCTLVWNWLRAGDVIVLIDELDLMAYDLNAKLLWREYCEPPHDVVAIGADLYVEADRLGWAHNYKGSFPAREGPPKSVQEQG